MSEAKVAVEKKGQDNPRELRNLVVRAVQEAGGTVDYAEASCVFPVNSIFIIWFIGRKKLKRVYTLIATPKFSETGEY